MSKEQEALAKIRADEFALQYEQLKQNFSDLVEQAKTLKIFLRPRRSDESYQELLEIFETSVQGFLNTNYIIQRDLEKEKDMNPYITLYFSNDYHTPLLERVRPFFKFGDSDGPAEFFYFTRGRYAEIKEPRDRVKASMEFFSKYCEELSESLLEVAETNQFSSNIDKKRKATEAETSASKYKGVALDHLNALKASGNFSSFVMSSPKSSPRVGSGRE